MSHKVASEKLKKFKLKKRWNGEILFSTLRRETFILSLFKFLLFSLYFLLMPRYSLFILSCWWREPFKSSFQNWMWSWQVASHNFLTFFISLKVGGELCHVRRCMSTKMYTVRSFPWFLSTKKGWSLVCRDFWKGKMCTERDCIGLFQSDIPLP